MSVKGGIPLVQVVVLDQVTVHFCNSYARLVAHTRRHRRALES